MKQNLKRSFVPNLDSKSNNHKRKKISSNEYDEITLKFNASAVKTVSTIDTDDSISVFDLTKDIENFNIKRNNTINNMIYLTKENVKTKCITKSTTNANLNNNFNFKKVFETIQKEKKSKSNINNPVSNLNTSISSKSEWNDNVFQLKNIIFDKQKSYELESKKRNIRNITSLKKSQLLRETINKTEKNKILEVENENQLYVDEEEINTPTFSNNQLNDSTFQNLKDLKYNCFIPKVRTSVNFSLFHDLKPKIKFGNTTKNEKNKQH